MSHTTGHSPTSVQALADAALSSIPQLAGLTDQAVVEYLILPYFRAAAPISGARHVVDVGGAYGSVASVFLREGWTADVFEPDPSCAAIVSQIAASFPDRCRLFPFAAGPENRDAVPFQQNAIPGLSGFDSSPFGAPQNVLAVRSVRLADFLVAQGVTRVDFLKVDTEGSDFEVLAAHDFDRLPPALIFAEFSYYFPRQTPEDVHAALTAMTARGYRAVIFEYDDDGNFQRGSWAHRLVAIHFEAGRVPRREHSFGNVLFYRDGDTRFLDACAAMFHTLR